MRLTIVGFILLTTTLLQAQVVDTSAIDDMDYEFNQSEDHSITV